MKEVIFLLFGDLGDNGIITAGGALEANEVPVPPPLDEGPTTVRPNPLVVMVGAVVVNPLLLPKDEEEDDDDDEEEEAKEPNDVPPEAAVANGLILAYAPKPPPNPLVLPNMDVVDATVVVSFSATVPKTPALLSFVDKGFVNAVGRAAAVANGLVLAYAPNPKPVTAGVSAAIGATVALISPSPSISSQLSDVS